MNGVAGWLGGLEGTRAATRRASPVGVLLVVAAFGLLVGVRAMKRSD